MAPYRKGGCCEDELGFCIVEYEKGLMKFLRRRNYPLVLGAFDALVAIASTAL